MALVVFIVVLMIPLVLQNDTDGYFFAGGVLGAVSSGVVLVSFLLHPSRRTPSMSLLSFRALCDMGIGFRFIFNSYFNQNLCGDSHCDIDDDEVGSNDELYRNCSAPSGMIEFFELASEAWFFCLAFDLAVSITNPFSSFSQRMKYYHVVSWGFGLGMALVLSLTRGLHGFWYVDESVDTTAICWIKSRKDGRLNFRTFVFLYIPLVVVYVYCLRVLSGAYSHLRKGISKTFQHRVRVLVMNSINIGIYMLYWAVLGVMYAFAYAFSEKNRIVSRWFWRVVMFIISSKGFADLIVFILVSDAQVPTGKGDTESLDVNGALRQEVLHYATTGIRECAARKTDSPSKRKLVLLMSQKNIPLQNILTLQHLLRLVFSGRDVSNSTNSMDTGGGLEEGLAQQMDTELLHVDDEEGGRVPARRMKPRRSTLGKMHAFPQGYGKDGESPPQPNPSEISGWESSRGVSASSVDHSEDRNQSSVASSPTITFVDWVKSSFTGRLDTGSTSSRSATKSSPDKSIRMSSLSSLESDVPHSAPVKEGLVDEETGEDTRHSSGSVSVDKDRDTVDEAAYQDFSFWGRLCYQLSHPSELCSWFSLNSTPDVSVEFVEYEPYYFRQIRLSSGVEDTDYITSFMKTIKERLTEGGASGAFFFFTKDEKFISKSCTLDEIAHIRRSSLMLSRYFQENPDSFITKIYGAYKLHIYGTSFYFFVTNNIFLNPDNEVINEKYDLKGSWVKRNSTPPQIGQRVTCTHCNQKFTFTGTRRNKKKSKGLKYTIAKLNPSSVSGRSVEKSDHSESSRCPMQVLGHHEPNVILKDNDLKYKIRLPGPTARFLLQQLEKDSDLLCSFGVMDYSLLVGVHNTEYVVDDATGFDGIHKTSTGSSTNIESKVITKSRTSKSDRKSEEEVKSPILAAASGGRDRNESDSSLAWVSERASQTTTPRSGRLHVSRIVGPEAYYMGIVDFQQLYDIGKKAERFFKVHVKGNSGEGLSCIEPKQYRARFLRRMEELLDLEDI
eukprot:CAMPEP_0185026992 /NCGR_PEP_ID=MMETSP1103-20130426/11740_1 /TAXON_ID=36769 /ORGANISM="Paraphysomonas bandaiensis, Strain Caron Lab Isolate" /LENGTH=1008 /DNA_ID=CAMNT_0027560801 /DNA_START=160 /DNA_END=3186 /DNA_ORIENTATION=-